jgi:hypothetical protein
MGKRIVIAVCGRARAGKDTFAEAFLESGFVNLKFASPLKAAMLALFPHMSDEHVNGELKDVHDPAIGDTPRAMMQHVGTDLLQHGLGVAFPTVGRRIFCDSMLARARAAHKAGADVVVTDMRFEHEKAALRRAFGDGVTFVKVVRAGMPARAAGHESESGVDGIECDIVVRNDRALSDLRAHAQRVLRRFEKTDPFLQT